MSNLVTFMTFIGFVAQYVYLQNSNSTAHPQPVHTHKIPRSVPLAASTAPSDVLPTHNAMVLVDTYSEKEKSYVPLTTRLANQGLPWDIILHPKVLLVLKQIAKIRIPIPYSEYVSKILAQNLVLMALIPILSLLFTELIIVSLLAFMDAMKNFRYHFKRRYDQRFRAIKIIARVYIHLFKTNRNLVKSKLCKMCYHNQVNCIIEPCGHAIYCSECTGLRLSMVPRWLNMQCKKCNIVVESVTFMSLAPIYEESLWRPSTVLFLMLTIVLTGFCYGTFKA